MLTVQATDPAVADQSNDRRRAFTCPGCGSTYAVVGDEAEAPFNGRTVQFPFKCPACDYEAALGVG